MRVGIFGICVFLASMMALVSVLSPSAPLMMDGRVLQRAPPDAYLTIEGFVYEADGVTPVLNCVVNITNKNTGAWGIATTDGTYGFYSFYAEALGEPLFYYDVVNVTATKGTQIGWTEVLVADAFIVLWIDVTLSAPETTGFMLELSPGWNFLSIPLLNDSCRASNLGLDRGSVVAAWDVTTQTESRVFVVGYTPPPYDFPLLRGEAFWIFSPHGQNVAVHGSSPAVYSQLSVDCSGPRNRYWIAFGFNTLGSDIHASDIPSMAVGVKVILVCRYNSPSGDYSNFLYGVTPSYLDFVIGPGDGCWLLVEGNGVLVYDPSVSSAPPIASFTVTSLSYDTIYVDALTSYDPNGYIKSYEWNWGDGTKSTGMVASHTYTTAQYRLVSLTITDNDGSKDTISSTFPTEPFLIHGGIFNTRADPIPNSTVSVTNLRTGSLKSYVADGSGMYEADLNEIQGGWQIGDIIRIEAQHQFSWVQRRDIPLTTQDAAEGSIHVDMVLMYGAPGPPWIVFGQTFGPDGVPVFGCEVRVTVLRSGEYMQTVSDQYYGYFELDIKLLPGGWMVGDIIRFSGTSGDMDASRDVLLTYDQVAKVGYVYADLYLRPPGAPPDPYFMNGYTKDMGGTPVPGCSVELTNLRTGASLETVSNITSGWYQVDLNSIVGGWVVGDTIRVVATIDDKGGSINMLLTDSGAGSVRADVILVNTV